MDLKKLGSNIAAIRRGKNMTQEAVALDVDISVTAYAKIERGETNVSFLRLLQIAGCLSVPVSAFVQEQSYDKIEQILKEINIIRTDVREIHDMVCVND